MSLDATEIRLTKIGHADIDESGIVVLEGWDGDGCTCRDVAVLALTHLIGILQKELLATIEKPGAGIAVVE